VSAREHVIVHQFDPAQQIAGGIEGFIVDLVRHAPPAHRFSIVGVDGTDSRELGVWHDITLAGRPIRFMPVARLSVVRPERRLPHTLRLVAGLLIRRPNVDGSILHAHRVEVGSALALSYPSNPLVQFVHTDSTELLQHRVESFWRFLPRTSVWLERRTVKHADQTIVMSATAARRLAADSANVSAGSNWFDDTIFYPAANAGDTGLVVGWVGRLEQSKNPVAAVDVFARLAVTDTSFRAWVAGSGSLEQALRARIEDCGLQDRVELLGTLEPEVLAQRLRETDVLLVTSLWEGQPRAVLEALGSGTRVVSPDVGDVRSLVVDRKGGFVASGRTADELATQVQAAAVLQAGAPVAATVSRYRASLAVPQLLNALALLPERGKLRSPRRR
jgi:glycosyltransferase involved in cell wall biosynthesis